MLPKALKPSNEYELIRLGQNNDGGYLVEKKSVLDSCSLITFGLGFDWSFEKDYFKLKNSPIYCYDHTVRYSLIKKISRKYLASFIFRSFKPKYFSKKNFFKDMKKKIFLYKDYKNFFNGKVNHIQSRIGSGSSGLKLRDVLGDKKNFMPAFLKIDIEGSEYRIMEEILHYQENFTGIAIEFHEVDLHLDKIVNFIKNLKLTLVHIHPQNPAFVTDDNIPTQIELSFARNPKIISSVAKIPHPLDQPANPDFEEIKLFFKDV
tara:strand:+ start:395 stop:1180 length:786 start_codon:yes stop_codon:yes gene_type:complete